MAAYSAVLRSPTSPARSLRRALLIRFGLVAIIPLLTMALIQGVILTIHDRTAAENDLAQASRSIGQRIRSHLLQHRQVIVALAKLIETEQDFTPRHLAAASSVTHTTYPGFAAVVATDRDGRLIASHPARHASGEELTTAGLNLANRAYFRQLLTTGRPTFSPAFRGRRFGDTPIVVIGAPARNATGTISTVVQGAIDLTRLSPLAFAAEPSAPMDIVVLDADRRVVFSTIPTRYPKLTQLADPFFAAATGPIRSFAVVGERPATVEDPERKLTARYDFTVSDGAPSWSIFVFQDLTVASSQTRDYWQRTALAALVVALAVFFLSRRVAASLVAPLDSLAASLGQFSLGAVASPQAPLGIDRFEETARLWSGFSGLATRLEHASTKLTQSEAALHSANANLASEVALRTSELAAERDRRGAAEADIRWLALVAEHTANLVVITDASGCIEWANPAFIQVTGYTLSEVKGRRPGSFLQGPDSDPATIAQMRRCLRAGQGFRVELLNYAKDRRPYWLEIMTQPVTGPDGAITHFVAIETDISDRKQAATQLLRQKNFLSTLQQTTLDLLAHRELKDVFQTLIGRATTLLRASFAELLLKEGDRFVICAHTHSDSFAGPLHVGRLEAPLAWRAHDSGQPVVLDDYATFAARPAGYENLSAHAVAAIPILLGDTCVGILSLGRTTLGDTFTADDCAHGTLLAQIAALVLHHTGIRETALREAADRTVALRESEARARAVFDQSPFINILASIPDGTLLEFNAVGLATFGYTRDQVIGQTSPSLGLWVDATARQHYLETLRTHSSMRNFETRMRRRDGTEFPVLCHGCIVTIGGQPYSLNTLEDITDRKRAEAALRESEERFRNVFDRSPVPIALAEFPSGRVIAANDAAVAIWQRPRLAILGHTALELGLWDNLADREKLHDLMRRDGVVHNFETRLNLRPGHTATVLFSAAMVTIAGRPYSLNTILDITERKASELARDASLALMRATLESTADGILVVNAHGRIATYNGIFARMWHLPAALAVADHDHIPHLIRQQLVAPDHLPANLGAPEAPSASEALATLACRDGRTYECYSRPQLIGDQPSGRVWSFRDITARRRAEEERNKFEDQLRHAQKMESLGTLAGGIAHDFNNILTGILGFTDLARLSLLPHHCAHECLDHILRSGHRARELVHQILTFSRSSSTKRTPHRLHHEVTEALQLLRSTLPAMVELEREIDPKTSPVLADATQIHQVVMNLCTNAWHALPPRGGRITVTLASHTVTAPEAAAHPDLTPASYVRLSVTDTGSGMSASTLEHIFEPFFTTKEVGKGTGLGLAVVHGVMKAHQGAITVQSSLGVGTTFRLYFPALVSPESPSAPPSPETIPRGRGQRLLFVDDDELSGVAIERLIATLGYKVMRFTSPTRALQLFTTQSAGFALALVDLAMPDMSGDTLAEGLLAVRPTLPVVMLTGYVEPERQAAILASGVREVLRKPPTLSELGQTLARHLPAPAPSNV